MPEKSMIKKYSGYLLKLTSLISKFLFLILLVPNLNDGIFSSYYLALTTCLILSRVFSFGASENIALIIKGSREKITDFLALYLIILLSSLLSALFYMLLNVSVLLHLFLILCFCGSNFLSGIVRGFSPESYETNINGPWILFIAGVLIFDISQPSDLILILAFSYLTTQVVVIFLSKTNKECCIENIKIKKTFALYFRIIPSGLIKQISIINQVLFIRIPFILPSYLGLASLSDKMALGLSIVEGLWQLFMVPVNRRFSNYCSAPVEFHQNSLKIFVTFVLFLSTIPFWNLFIYASSYIDILSLPSFDFFLIPGLILSSVLLLTDMRYWCWSHKLWGNVIVTEIFIILTYSIITVLTQRYHFYEYWIPSIYILMVSLILYIMLNISSKKPRLKNK